MAATKKELQDWLATVPDDAFVGIDEGGLSLVVMGSENYFEIGGIPEEDSDDDRD